LGHSSVPHTNTFSTFEVSYENTLVYKFAVIISIIIIITLNITADNAHPLRTFVGAPIRRSLFNLSIASMSLGKSSKSNICKASKRQCHVLNTITIIIYESSAVVDMATQGCTSQMVAFERGAGWLSNFLSSH